MPPIDKNARLNDTTDYPARSLRAITPSDSAELDFIPKALWIGGAGSITVQMLEDASTVQLTGCQPGQIIPIRVKKVMATGTTATGIVAMI
jgi:hypothetical protein